jgi:hypothetical protein
VSVAWNSILLWTEVARPSYLALIIAAYSKPQEACLLAALPSSLPGWELGHTPPCQADVSKSYFIIILFYISSITDELKHLFCAH